MDSRDNMGEGDAPLRKFHWNFVADEEEEWRACSDYLLELFREDCELQSYPVRRIELTLDLVKRKREIEEEEEEKKKKDSKKPRLFFRRWSAPLAPVLSAVPAVAAPAITVRRFSRTLSFFTSSELPHLHQSMKSPPLPPFNFSIHPQRPSG
ncbi:hypothetical protein FGLOB1_14435 [Fusarium globosum]|uniref:Uncharacterized protein n=1 Tax=Fusarium globosum TaxID=78864 RepID=A0A8H6CV64_9HYPO|nr:hypothetical protein FGLOB1_14435 [Fusarium globosum]